MTSTLGSSVSSSLSCEFKEYYELTVFCDLNPLDLLFSDSITNTSGWFGWVSIREELLNVLDLIPLALRY